MGKLILLYFGTIILAYLSQRYYPVKADELSEKRHFMRDKADVFCVAIIVWMTLFNGLKTAYNDTWNYRYYFSTGANTVIDFLESKDSFKLLENQGFYFLQTIVKQLTGNYHVWFLLVATINSVSVIKFFKQYSISFCFSIMLYHSIGTYIMYLASMKQSVAVAIIMWAIPFLLRRKWIIYYVLIVVAMTFHSNAFLFLFIPFFVGKPWKKTTYICLFGTLFTIITYDNTFGFFLEYAQHIGARVFKDELFTLYNVNYMRVVVYAVPVAISFVFRRQLFKNSTPNENLFVNMSILSCLILSIGLVKGGNLFGRMAGYFEWATAISLPWMINKLFKPKSRQFIYICAGVLYFGYFLFEFGVSKSFGDNYSAIGLLEFIKTLF